jgi:hypothetical protein
MNISLQVDTTIEGLATMLRQYLSYDDQIAVIAELDAQNADSEFTRRLIELTEELKADLGSGLEEL